MGTPGASGASGKDGAMGRVGQSGPRGLPGAPGVGGLAGRDGAPGGLLRSQLDSGPRAMPGVLNPFPRDHMLAYRDRPDTVNGPPKATPIPNLHGNVIWRHYTWEHGVNNFDAAGAGGFTAQGELTFRPATTSPSRYGLGLVCEVPLGGSGLPCGRG